MTWVIVKTTIFHSFPGRAPGYIVLDLVLPFYSQKCPCLDQKKFT